MGSQDAGRSIQVKMSSHPQETTHWLRDMGGLPESRKTFGSHSALATISTFLRTGSSPEPALATAISMSHWPRCLMRSLPSAKPTILMLDGLRTIRLASSWDEMRAWIWLRISVLETEPKMALSAWFEESAWDVGVGAWLAIRGDTLGASASFG